MSEGIWDAVVDLNLKSVFLCSQAVAKVMMEKKKGDILNKGLNVKIVPTEYGSVRSEWIGGKALDYAWTHRGLPFPGAAIGIQLEHTAAMNFAQFVTEKTETMVSDIMKEPDLKKRSALAKETGEYLRDEASGVFLGFANKPYTISKRVGKWPMIRQYPTKMEYVTRP
jgi:ABC-type transport system substrate-binding protein